MGGVGLIPCREPDPPHRRVHAGPVGTFAGVREVWSAFKKTRLARAIAWVLSIAGVVGLVSLPTDLAQWGEFLTGIDSQLALGALYVITLAIGVGLLIDSLSARRRTRREAEARRSRTAVTAPDPERLEAMAGPRPPRSTDARQPIIRRAPIAGGRAELISRLQRQLDEGVKLQKHTRPLGGLSYGLQRSTTQMDVDMWAKATRRAMTGHPRLVSEFNYEKPRSPLENTFINSLTPFKRELDQRVDNLASIIEDLTRNG